MRWAPRLARGRARRRCDGPGSEGEKVATKPKWLKGDQAWTRRALPCLCALLRAPRARKLVLRHRGGMPDLLASHVSARRVVSASTNTTHQEEERLTRHPD